MTTRHFKFIEFNPRRAMRSADAVKVEVSTDGEWLWMGKRDIRANVKQFGAHPKLQKAMDAYGALA